MTRNFKNRIAVGAILTALLALFAVPAVASAQAINPTEDQYDNIINLQGGGSTDPNDTPPPSGQTGVGSETGSGSGSGLSADVGPLPFTGFDVIAMIAVALAVTGLGLGLRYAISRQPSSGLGS
ncbi:hypothetical protein HJD18_07175 [Thermoleophilia bacterium SCSIO 60948]|nr:hypothetical protein HJD18_07175 [Thermoleophilia bacterium SCSIO 60948]